MVLIAHAGHWLTTIAYFIPVLGFLIWLISGPRTVWGI